MKKIGFTLFLFTFALIGCNKEKIPEDAPKSISISGDLIVIVNSSATYVASFDPSSASKSIKWSVDDETLATIDENGKLTTNNNIGIVTIYATSRINNEVSGNYTVCIAKSEEKVKFYNEYYNRFGKSQELGMNYYNKVSLLPDDNIGEKKASEAKKIGINYTEGDYITSFVTVSDKSGSLSIGLATIRDYINLYISTLIMEEVCDVKYKFYENNNIGFEGYKNDELVYKTIFDQNCYVIEDYAKYSTSGKVSVVPYLNLHITYIREA